jgi:predicted phage terminase large subunit-like protein
LLDLNINPNKAKAELCKRNFFFFVQEFWSEIIPDDPVYNWHIEYLCDELQKIVERVARREDKLYDLVINIPPGTSKSTIATVMLPAWAWTIDSRIRNLTASYSASLSTDHAVKSRDIIKSDKYKLYFPELAIKSDQDNKTHYKNENGGERYATSVTGTVTGFHAHLIIVDDPLNPKGASSEADRLTANSFMDTTLSTRKVSKSVTPTILVMQRLHQKDCTGNWLEKEGKNIKHICLPGEISNDVKPVELKDRYIDGLLDTKRLNRKDLKELKVNLGSYGYAGQIMQIPSPLDGGIWQKWIKPIDDNELNALLPNLQSIGSDWDLAYTEKQSNSASAFITAGKHDNKMYITDLGFDWMEFPKLMSYMKSKKAPHYIEAKASGKSAKQTLSNQGIPAIEVNVTGGDKEARANMVTPYAESGVIYCRQSILDKLYYDPKQGILMFPNGEGDDLQDALVQSISRLLGNHQVFFF